MKEDAELIAEVLQGQTASYEELVKRYQKPIYFTCLRMLSNPESADEVTQKTFIKAYRALAGFEFRSSLKTWLSAIAMNLCRTELSKKKRIMVELPVQLSNQEYENLSEKEELEHQRAYLKKALEELPTRQKEVVVLRIYQELPFKEIAQALESTETAVKVNFHHAMKSLKEWIKKNHPQEK